jgi:hypothetical protein
MKNKSATSLISKSLVLISSVSLLAACGASGSGSSAATNIPSLTPNFTGYPSLNATGAVKSSGEVFSAVTNTSQAKTTVSGTYFKGSVSVGQSSSQFR